VTASAVLAYVRKNPGARCADVAAYFEVSCLAAGGVLRALRADGKVKSRGNTRGVRYTAR
jgi:hypothetical protein